MTSHMRTDKDVQKLYPHIYAHTHTHRHSNAHARTYTHTHVRTYVRTHTETIIVLKLQFYTNNKSTYATLYKEHIRTYVHPTGIDRRFWNQRIQGPYPRAGVKCYTNVFLFSSVSFCVECLWVGCTFFFLFFVNFWLLLLIDYYSYFYCYYYSYYLSWTAVHNTKFLSRSWR